MYIFVITFQKDHLSTLCQELMKETSEEQADTVEMAFLDQNICMGFVKSSIFRWSRLKVFKHWVKPLKIKNYALNKSKI